MSHAGCTGGSSRIRTADLWIMIPLKYVFDTVDYYRYTLYKSTCYKRTTGRISSLLVDSYSP
jgi:hypothetical protein